MNYSEFLSAVRNNMEDRYKNGASVLIHPVLKNNGLRLDGLLILQPGENISPTIYLNPYYDRYLSGTGLEDILDDIEAAYEEHHYPMNFNTSLFRDFSYVRDKISFRLINRASNMALLSDIPFLPFLDLAVVFYFHLEHEFFGSSTVLIHKEHMALWDTDCEELYTLACANTRSLTGCELFPMETLIRSFLDPSDQFPLKNLSSLYVLTNKSQIFGAACLLYEDVLADFARVCEDDFYVLPSSVHEVLLLPVKKSPPVSSLLDMVHEINRTEVPIQDVLSDQIYLYRCAVGKLGLVLLTPTAPEKVCEKDL
ncbi:DUF5688 family protein [Fusibacillus kribbianus]|uniref:DUF5688 family protein n=1 Tax=Fusibacillus kribbianus TaxID=3044208 RepID=A0AAP4B934_9FIRM|nr:DUF5688 family protein [Ruminococcus sp. YH-rum2234]MDI9241805.1 DUF5688 family protein [Ruminococcus sp. YH-rum2234]